VQNLIKHAEETLGPVDILVNNAGVMYYTHMTSVLMDDWDRMIEVNCKGVTNGVGAVLPGMVERGRGHIVNMSSDAGRAVSRSPYHLQSDFCSCDVLIRLGISQFFGVF